MGLKFIEIIQSFTTAYWFGPLGELNKILACCASRWRHVPSRPPLLLCLLWGVRTVYFAISLYCCWPDCHDFRLPNWFWHKFERRPTEKGRRGTLSLHAHSLVDGIMGPKLFKCHVRISCRPIQSVGYNSSFETSRPRVRQNLKVARSQRIWYPLHVSVGYSTLYSPHQIKTRRRCVHDQMVSVILLKLNLNENRLCDLTWSPHTRLHSRMPKISLGLFSSDAMIRPITITSPFFITIISAINILVKYTTYINRFRIYSTLLFFLYILRLLFFIFLVYYKVYKMSTNYFCSFSH